MQKEKALELVLTTLSRQEREVFKRIAKGESPILSAIAMELSPKTVATYRARIMEKLALHSNAEIAVLAFELGMVESVMSKLRSGENNAEENNGAKAPG